DGEVLLEWTGGVPPYRVQACTDGRLLWRDVSEFLFGTKYNGPTRGDFVLFRVRSASDTIAPGVPGPVSINAMRCDAVALSWQPAVDDAEGSGIQAYRVYRDGAAIADVAQPDTFFLDKTVDPQASYSYTITALDFLNNESIATAATIATTQPCLGESGPMTELTIAWDPSEERNISGY